MAFNQLKTYSETTKTQLDNLDVGVRNIFLNSSLTDNLDKWSFQSTSPTFTTKDNKKCAKISGALKTGRSIYQGIFGKLEPDTTYTMSGWVYTENIVKGETNFILSYYIDGYYDNNGTSTWFGCGQKALPLNSNKWVYLTWTFTTDSRISTSTSMLAYLYARDFTGSVYVYNLKLEKGNKATVWMPAVEDVDGAIESVKEVTESHSTTIGVMQGQISTAINNTKIVKDGQTILLKDDYNRTVQTIDSMKVTIGQHTSKIDGLNSTVSTQTSDISQLKNQIKLKVEQTDINTAVNNIQIGYTNLIDNSTFNNITSDNKVDKWAINNQNNTTIVTGGVDGGKCLKIIGALKQTYAPQQILFNLEKNQVYTFTGYYKCENVVRGTTNPHIFIHASYYLDGTWKSEFTVSEPIIGTKGWTKVTKTFRTRATDDWNRFGISCYVRDCTGVVWFDHFKLEMGNKPTAWSPSIGDVDDSIDKVDTKITNTNNKVSSIEANLSSITSRVGTVESKQTTTDGKVTSLETRMSSAESKITESAITNTVKKNFYTKSETDKQITSKGYQTSSQVQQTVNAFELKFQESGGYNLLYNGDFRNSTANWSNTGFNAYYNVAYSTASRRAVRAVGALKTSYACQQTTSKINGGAVSYTISYWYYVSDATDGTTNPYYHVECAVTYTDGTITYNTNRHTTIGKWTKTSMTMTKPSGKTFESIKVSIICRDTTRTVYVGDVMLEEGTLATAFTPNPNEVFDGITSIDKGGITVTASNVKSKTTMSANGFKITKTDTNEDVFKVNSNGRLLLDGEFTTHNGTRKSGYFGSDQVKFYNWWADTNEEIAYFYGGKTSDNKRSADIVGRDMFSIGVGTPTSGSKVLEGSSSKLFIYKNTDFGNYKISNLNGINEGTSKDIWLGNTFLRSNQLNTNMESGILNLNYWKGYNSTGSVEVKVGNGNNDSARGTLTCQNFKAYGTKNACVQTSVGYVDINAYETCDYYFGDIGETILDNEGYSYVYIDSLFSETVNTQRKYQVFLSIYGEGTANVVKRTPIYFVIKGTPGIEVGYEIKAKRKGYEDYRLERDINPWRKGEEHGLDEDYNNERIEFNRKIENIINEEVIKDIENETLQEFISSEVERSIENIELMKTIEEDIFNENIN